MALSIKSLLLVAILGLGVVSSAHARAWGLVITLTYNDEFTSVSVASKLTEENIDNLKLADAVKLIRNPVPHRNESYGADIYCNTSVPVSDLLLLISAISERGSGINSILIGTPFPHAYTRLSNTTEQDAAIASDVQKIEAIKCLVEDLNRQPFWTNGLYAPLHLPENASFEQLTSAYLKESAFKGALIHDYKIEEAEVCNIPPDSNEAYKIVRISSEQGGKFLIFRYTSEGWWTRNYDVKEQYMKKSANTTQ